MGCLLAIRERRGLETQSMMLAEVVQRNAKQLAEECAQGRRATIGVRFFGAEGTQYALSTILESRENAGVPGATDFTAAASDGIKVRTREGDATGAQAHGAAAMAHTPSLGHQGQDKTGEGEERGRADNQGNSGRSSGADTQQHPAAGVSAQFTAAAAAIARQDIATDDTPPLPPPPPHVHAAAGPSTPASPQVARAPAAAELERTSGHRSNAQRASTASEAELPLLVHAVQVAHDFGVCKPVLQALQEDRLLTPPFGDTLFSAAGQPPQTGHVEPPAWQTDEAMAGWLQERLDTMDPTQHQAFDHALSRKVALVQGPPGVCFFHMIWHALCTR